MVEKWTCPQCEQKLFKVHFYKWRRGWRKQFCNRCYQAIATKNRQSAEGWARKAFENMRLRAENRSGRHPTYSNVQLRISRNEFIEWVLAEMPWFQFRHPGLRPSIDRKDARSHYELGNIQLLPQRENSRKRECCVSCNDAEIIRYIYSTGELTQPVLADFFCTSTATISRIVNRKTHVELSRE